MVAGTMSARTNVASSATALVLGAITLVIALRWITFERYLE